MDDQKVASTSEPATRRLFVAGILHLGEREPTSALMTQIWRVNQSSYSFPPEIDTATCDPRIQSKETTRITYDIIISQDHVSPSHSSTLITSIRRKINLPFRGCLGLNNNAANIILALLYYMYLLHVRVI